MIAGTLRAVDLHFCSAYVAMQLQELFHSLFQQEQENGILSDPYGPKAKVKTPHSCPLLAF
jgi:hypothetical protein